MLVAAAAASEAVITAGRGDEQRPLTTTTTPGAGDGSAGGGGDGDRDDDGDGDGDGDDDGGGGDGDDDGGRHARGTAVAADVAAATDLIRRLSATAEPRCCRLLCVVRLFLVRYRRRQNSHTYSVSDLSCLSWKCLFSE